ncbi:hypothetical protein EV421DRAFT_2036789 [Armillaria borealis]|uniref:Uncharacterized protein n=1 Tax=Armillaria borealis TaxID=47425 RepID=A0AA39JDF6_9AGAR|nr:hypothetical protein EV421DRAFT_2036789 [Armillaria borealis]
MDSPDNSPNPNVRQLLCYKKSPPRTRAETIALRRLWHVLYVEDSPEYRSFRELNTAYRNLFDSYTTVHEHARYAAKTKQTGLLVSTIDYVVNLSEKHQVLIQKISSSMAELMVDDAAILSDSLARECSAFAETVEVDVTNFLTEIRKTFEAFKRYGLLDVTAGLFGHISAYALTTGGVGLLLSRQWLPAQLHGVTSPSVILPILTIPAYVSFRSLRLLRRLERAAAVVYRELCMFIAARLELAGWIESLATLRGVGIASADCRSAVLLATSRLAKLQVIFNSGLEHLHSAQDAFAADYKLWDDLPSHPLPTASETPRHDITDTRYSAVTPAGHPSSITSHPESVKGSLDDHAMTPDPDSSQTVSGAVKASSSHAEGREIESSSDSHTWHIGTEGTPLLDTQQKSYTNASSVGP